MNEEEITLIILGIISIMLIIQTIFRMKYKRDMYIEHLKQYESGTSYIDDKIMEKLFNIEKYEEDCERFK